KPVIGCGVDAKRSDCWRNHTRGDRSVEGACIHFLGIGSDFPFPSYYESSCRGMRGNYRVLLYCDRRFQLCFGGAECCRVLNQPGQNPPCTAGILIEAVPDDHEAVCTDRSNIRLSLLVCSEGVYSELGRRGSRLQIE